MTGKLNFTVLVKKQPKGSRFTALSTIFVRMGTTTIATRTIPGKWDEEMARVEFRKSPDRFTSKDATTYTPDILRRLAA